MEIERKYLVERKEFEKYIKDFPERVNSKIDISQYYIPALNGTFRLRRKRNNDNSFLFTIALKKFVKEGVNEEIEVNIDSNTAYEIINGIKDIKSLHKIRYVLNIDGYVWEVDLLDNGITLAEIEFKTEHAYQDNISEPYFLREQVTGRYEFSNEYIANYLSGQ